jgi:hypothetical protein
MFYHADDDAIVVARCQVAAPSGPLPTTLDRSSLFLMTTVAEISGAVKRLPKRELARFRKWFIEYDAAIWDRQIEADSKAGKLASLIREARSDHKAGRTKLL